MNARRLPLAVFVLCFSATVGAGETNTLEPHLEPLRALLGQTFRGAFKSSQPDQPVTDVLRWERALNGMAVRTLHSINDGLYGGETLYVWDPREEVVKYFYFTTAGFRTTGTLKFTGGKFVTHEIVQGTAGGVTEVKAESELQRDGRLVVKVEHLKEGKWVQARNTIYEPAAKAEVNFR
jgi:hypothetical protein